MKIKSPAFALLLATIASFVLGAVSSLEKGQHQAPMCLEERYQEIALLEFKALKGDLLLAHTDGPVRLIWNDSFIEGSGEHEIALGQLESDADKPFREFAYVGNVGTMKFYPADSYPGRGTDPLKRRFFANKEAAFAAGFTASKLVK